MKQQVIVLKIKYDETEYAPKSWNWSEILKCNSDCVEVMNYGKVEEVDERVS